MHFSGQLASQGAQRRSPSKRVGPLMLSPSIAPAGPEAARRPVHFHPLQLCLTCARARRRYARLHTHIDCCMSARRNQTDSNGLVR